MKSTRSLERAIHSSASPDLLSEEIFSLPELSEYLWNLLRRQGVPLKDMIRRCNLIGATVISCSTVPGGPPGTR